MEFVTSMKSIEVLPLRSSLFSQETINLGILLAIAQTLDAILTMTGVAHFGTNIEANTFLQSLMHHFDPYLVLASIKMGAIAIVITLVYISHHVWWICKAMGFVSGLYLGSAILPWLYVFFRHLA